MILAIITLISGLAISAVAIYYSVIGLAAIFAAAVLPIIIMGTILEISKLVSAWWLKKNWKRAPVVLKYYMLTAVIVLMFITSMGIFGFLSKAHVEQNVPTGDIVAQIESLDEQIALEQRIIEQSKDNLKVLDDQIERYTELGAVTKGVNARKEQKEERDFLNAAIRESQTKVTELRRAKLPLSGDLRQVEAEVGPVKYIAQLIYGDNPDQTLLEKAVVLVILILVFVFDPLAILLLLAAQLSFQWYYDEKRRNVPHKTILEAPTQIETPATDVIEEEPEDQAADSDPPENPPDYEDVPVVPPIDAATRPPARNTEPVMGGSFDNAPTLDPILIPVVKDVEEKTLFEQLEEGIEQNEQQFLEKELTDPLDEAILENTADTTFIRTNDSMEVPNEEVERSAEEDSIITNNIDTIELESQSIDNLASETVVEDEREEVEEQSVEPSSGDDLPQKDEINRELINVEVNEQDLGQHTNINEPSDNLELDVKHDKPEQPETAAPQPAQQQREIQDEELKKKSSFLDRTDSDGPTDKTLNRELIPGYIQNEEQSPNSIWRRIREAGK